MSLSPDDPDFFKAVDASIEAVRNARNGGPPINTNLANQGAKYRANPMHTPLSETSVMDPTYDTKKDIADQSEKLGMALDAAGVLPIIPPGLRLLGKTVDELAMARPISGQLGAITFHGSGVPDIDKLLPSKAYGNYSGMVHLTESEEHANLLANMRPGREVGERVGDFNVTYPNKLKKEIESEGKEVRAYSQFSGDDGKFYFKFPVHEKGIPSVYRVEIPDDLKLFDANKTYKRKELEEIFGDISSWMPESKKTIRGGGVNPDVIKQAGFDGVRYTDEVVLKGQPKKKYGAIALFNSDKVIDFQKLDKAIEDIRKVRDNGSGSR